MYDKYTPLYIHIKWKKLNLSPISRPITIGNSIENIYNYYQIFKAVFLQTVFAIFLFKVSYLCKYFEYCNM